MRRGYEEAHGELEDHKVPAKDYVEAKLGQLEGGDVKAERLTEAIAQDEIDGEPWGTLRVGSDNVLKVTKGSNSEAKTPANSEGLRMRLRTVERMWEFIRLKMPTHIMLHGA